MSQSLGRKINNLKLNIKKHLSFQIKAFKSRNFKMDFIFISMVYNNGVKGIKQGILVSKYFITKMHKEPIERQLLD